MTIPRITKEQALVAFSGAAVPLTLLEIYNERIDTANAQQTYISAGEARKLGMGNAEFRNAHTDQWIVCGDSFKYHPDFIYRAIQPQAQPFSLNAMVFIPKRRDISCYVSKDGEPAIRMLRTDAQTLQSELGDSVEWLLNALTKPSFGGFDFGAEGIYTYKNKANLIKLGGAMVTREQAVAEWKAKELTHDIWCAAEFAPEFELQSGVIWRSYSDQKFEFQLRAKPAKVVKWADVPVGVMTDKGECRGTYTAGGEIFMDVLEPAPNGNGVVIRSKKVSDGIELAPAADQTWIAFQGKNIHEQINKLAMAGFALEVDGNRYRVLSLAEGYKMEGSK